MRESQGNLPYKNFYMGCFNATDGNDDDVDSFWHQHTQYDCSNNSMCTFFPVPTSHSFNYQKSLNKILRETSLIVHVRVKQHRTRVLNWDIICAYSKILEYSLEKLLLGIMNIRASKSLRNATMRVKYGFFWICIL